MQVTGVRLNGAVQTDKQEGPEGRVALVHDWLPVYAGAERVLEQMLHLFPSADLFSLIEFLPPDQRTFLQGRPVQTSFIQRLPLPGGLTATTCRWPRWPSNSSTCAATTW